MNHGHDHGAADAFWWIPYAIFAVDLVFAAYLVWKSYREQPGPDPAHRSHPQESYDHSNQTAAPRPVRGPDNRVDPGQRGLR